MIKKRYLLLTSFILLVWFVIVTGNNAEKQNFNRAPSLYPPSDLNFKNIPQFVLISSDDNTNPKGLEWLIKLLNRKNNPDGKSNSRTYDGEQISMSLFWNTFNGGNTHSSEIVSTLRFLHDTLECEVTNHTAHHRHGGGFSLQDWIEEMEKVDKILKDSIISNKEKIGFRTPFLEYNKNTFRAVQELGMIYDSSIEEGFQKELEPGNYFWPYTLNHINTGYKSSGRHQKLSEKHPDYVISKWDYNNLWEIPCYALQAPPDSILKRKYEAEPGIRDQIKKATGNSQGKIPGLDWNLWAAPEGDGAELNAEQTLAVLKYSFDKTYGGNRAPFTLVIHSPFYFSEGKFDNINNQEQKDVIEEFINYILQKEDVRVVSIQKYLKWLIDPIAL